MSTHFSAKECRLSLLRRQHVSVRVPGATLHAAHVDTRALSVVALLLLTVAGFDVVASIVVLASSVRPLEMLRLSTAI
jgi:hypothetical protein